jgi:uncharacterized protein (TIGR03435 family)
MLRTIPGWRAAAFLLLGSAAFAQNGQVRPSFEAASVKKAEQGRPGPGPLRGGPGTSSPGQLSGISSLKALLMRAYDVKGYQITGPAWMESERYEIAAKIPAGAESRQVALMLQSLLTERFQLAAHRETKVFPIYEMVVGKDGPKFKQSLAADEATLLKQVLPKITQGRDGFPEIPAGSDVPRSYEVVVGGSDAILFKLWARRETMQQLADRLSGQLNRAVVDRTQLKEQYDFTLAWSMENAGGGIPRTDYPPDEIEFHDTPVPSDPALSIFAAVQSQLGLRLEVGRGPLEMLIVDRVERTPIGN